VNFYSVGVVTYDRMQEWVQYPLHEFQLGVVRKTMYECTQLLLKNPSACYSASVVVVVVNAADEELAFYIG
jgi:hypothetical protein